MGRNFEQHSGVKPFRLHRGYAVKPGGKHFVLVEYDRSCAGKPVQNKSVLYNNTVLQRAEQPGKIHERQRREKGRRTGDDKKYERAVNSLLCRRGGKNQKEKRNQNADAESERGIDARVTLHGISFGTVHSVRLGNGADCMRKNGVRRGAERRTSDGGADVDSPCGDLLSGCDFTPGGMSEDRGKIQRGGAFQNFEIRRGALAAFENENVAELNLLR